MCQALAEPLSPSSLQPDIHSPQIRPHTGDRFADRLAPIKTDRPTEPPAGKHFRHCSVDQHASPSGLVLSCGNFGFTWLNLCAEPILGHVLVATDACFRSSDTTPAFPHVNILINYNLAVRKVQATARRTASSCVLVAKLLHLIRIIQLVAYLHLQSCASHMSKSFKLTSHQRWQAQATYA